MASNNVSVQMAPKNKLTTAYLSPAQVNNSIPEAVINYNLPKLIDPPVEMNNGSPAQISNHKPDSNIDAPDRVPVPVKPELPPNTSAQTPSPLENKIEMNQKTDNKATVVVNKDTNTGGTDIISSSTISSSEATKVEGRNLLENPNYEALNTAAPKDLLENTQNTAESQSHDLEKEAQGQNFIELAKS